LFGVCSATCSTHHSVYHKLELCHSVLGERVTSSQSRAGMVLRVVGEHVALHTANGVHHLTVITRAGMALRVVGEHVMLHPPLEVCNATCSTTPLGSTTSLSPEFWAGVRVQSNHIRGQGWHCALHEGMNSLCNATCFSHHLLNACFGMGAIRLRKLGCLDLP
jgi:hypothetical protein